MRIGYAGGTHPLQQGMRQGVRTLCRIGYALDTHPERRCTMSKRTKARVALEALTKEEIMEWLEKAVGHTNDFQEFYGTAFSYSTLKSYAAEKGYIEAPEKPPEAIMEDVIIIKRSKREKGSTTRITLTVSKDLAKEYQERFKDINEKSLINDELIRQFLNKKIIIEREC